MSAIGIMDGAFFVGRKEIIDWINYTLDLNITRVEDTASGAIACELLDIMFPGTVPMHKVNWAANKDFEFVANYKILQTAFTKNAIDKYVDVDRLISAKYMDNLEFMQWFKRFFEMHNASKEDYDTIGQRAKGKGGSSFFPAKGGSIPSAPPPSSSTVQRKVSNAPTPVTATKKVTPSAESKSNSSLPLKSKPVVSKASTSSTSAPTSAAPRTVRASTKTDDVSVTTIETLQNEVGQLKITSAEYEKTIADLKDDVEATEKERDFYFEKLRDIEILLQAEEGREDELIKSIFKILYATAEGFEVVTGDETENAEEVTDTY